MNDSISVVIAIGGKGTRLQKVTGNIPKPLYPVAGTSTLKRTLDELNKFGFKKIILTTCFEKKLFKEFFSKNKFNFDELFIYEEEMPLGECGALWKIKEKLESTTLFINGDLIFSIDFQKLLNFHFRLNADISLVTHPSSHPEDSDMISCPNGTFVEGLFHKNRDWRDDKIKPLLGFAGISVFKKSIIDDMSEEKIKKPNLFSFLVNWAFKNGKKIYSYNTSEYIKDMGTEKRYLEVTNAINKNLLKKKNYNYKQNALFLDRDNTLISCKENAYILSIDDINFIDENISKISRISKTFSLIAIITNQPQISMNKLSLEELENINNHIILYCRSKSLFIDTVIWCPHHPHKGYESEIKFLKKDCFCRKPNPGMLMELSYQRNIDLKNSLFIGDSKVDKEAAESAGCEFTYIFDL
tara:strand:+ start:2020 stop:3258 length:1239 start_codon:yes stop_codon:yes gene_type:complete